MPISPKELFTRIFEIAQSCGYSIYVVGGYVRDALLDKPGKDFDFVVVGNAMRFADQLKKDLHLRRIVRYPRFGTFMARYYGYTLEFVNAREESYTKNSRKPVTKEADLYTDLSRRDFTINTLAMDISPEKYGEIIDVYNGRKDLKNKIIRTPLEPVQTFSDDPLRMLRAIRFATQLDFQIEKKTYQSIKETSERLSIISQERITDEFIKIIMTPQPSKGFLMLEETGLLEIILPEMTTMKGVEQRKKYHHKDAFYHTLEVLDNVAKKSKDLKLRMAAIFHDIAKPRTRRFDENSGWTFHGHEVVGKRMAGAILRKMKFSSGMVKYVQKLVSLHLRPMALVNEEVTDSAIRRLIFLSGDDLDDLIKLCRADITSKNIVRVKKYIKNYDRVVKKIHEVEARDHIRNFQPPVDGNEIMKMFNIEPGPAIGRAKKFMEQAILNGDIPNDHDACVKFILEKKEQFL